MFITLISTAHPSLQPTLLYSQPLFTSHPSLQPAPLSSPLLQPAVLLHWNNANSEDDCNLPHFLSLGSAHNGDRAELKLQLCARQQHTADGWDDMQLHYHHIFMHGISLVTGILSNGWKLNSSDCLNVSSFLVAFMFRYTRGYFLVYDTACIWCWLKCVAYILLCDITDSTPLW